jgi:hypothetical protein
MRCLGRLGCLLLVLILIIAAWYTRNFWLPQRLRSHPATSSAPAATWQPLNDSGVSHTRAALSELSQPHGPVFQTLSGADVASYVFSTLARHLPASTDSIQAIVQDDQLSMRANVRVADLGNTSALGPLASMLGERATIALTGTLHVIRPGLAEFEIRSATLKSIEVPHAMIPNIIARMDRGLRPAGVAPDALPLPIPAYIGDIRVANGKITLYKTVG